MGPGQLTQSVFITLQVTERGEPFGGTPIALRTPLTSYTKAETAAKPGPYAEIKEADVFVNCIYLSEPIPPFIDVDFLKQGTRNLSVM